MTPDREPRQDRFSDGEDLALPGLGALAWLDRFAAASEPRADAVSTPDEALISAALGLLSLRRTLHRWAGQAEDAATATPPMADEIDGLLR